METFKVYQIGKEQARNQDDHEKNLRKFEDALARLIADTCDSDQNSNFQQVIEECRNQQQNSAEQRKMKNEDLDWHTRKMLAKSRL